MTTRLKIDNWVLVVFFIALSLRLIYVLSLTYSPYSDMLLYDTNAVSVSRGQGVPANAYVDQYPVYPYLLGSLYLVLGQNYTAVRVVQAVLSSMTCVLAYLLAKRIFADSRTALIAGLMAALYPDLILHSGSILTETMYTLLLTATLWSWQVAQDDPSLVNRVLVGIFMGAAILTRSVMAVFVPFALGWGIIRTWPKWQMGARFVTVIGVVAILTYVPWAWRNYQSYHTITPVSLSVGFGLWGGNNPQADGYWVEEPWTLEQKAYLDTLPPAEANQYAVRQGVDWIRNNPLQFAQLVGMKVSRLFSLKPDAIYKSNFYGKYMEAIVPVVARAILWTLALIGGIYSVSLWRRLGLLYALFLSHLLITIIFFAYARYLVPLVPALAVLAAYGLRVCFRTWDALRQHKQVTLATTAWLSIVLVILLLANWGWDTARNLDTLRTWQQVESLTECQGQSLERCTPVVPTVTPVP